MNITEFANYIDKIEYMEQKFTLISVDHDDPDGNPEKTWDISVPILVPLFFILSHFKVKFDNSDGLMTEKLSVTQRR